MNQDSVFKFPYCDYTTFTTVTSYGNEHISLKRRKVKVCDELHAIIHEKAKLNDKKLFSPKDGYMKPYDIMVTGTKAKTEFHGLIHASEDAEEFNPTISPLETLELVSALEAFVGNNLNTNKAYRNDSFIFYVTTRDNNLVLCIDYGNNKKKSYLDKYYCRSAVSIIRNILNTSEYRL